MTGGIGLEMCPIVHSIDAMWKYESTFKSYLENSVLCFKNNISFELC